MGTDIHPAIEVRRKGVWHYHRPKTPCPRYYEHRWDPTTSSLVWVLDAAGNQIRSKWDNCKYALPQCFTSRNYLTFSYLADVRNYWDDIEVAPISLARGLPADVTDGALRQLSDEHTESWVTLQEMLDHDYSQVISGDGREPNKFAIEHTNIPEMMVYMKALIPKGGTANDVRLVFDFDS